MEHIQGFRSRTRKLLLLLGMSCGIGACAAAQAAPQLVPVKPAVDAAAVAGPSIPKDAALLSGENLKPSQRESFRRLLQKFPSPCGKPHSLLTSVKTDPQCRLAIIAVRWIAKLFADEALEGEVEDRYLKRFGASKCEPIDIAGAQIRGDKDAPIVLIKFSDFECEHCRALEPVLTQVLAESKNVKLVLMNYPMQMHPNAATAAAAALAAGRQGKFWQYHDKLFENPDRLQRSKLLLYAGEMKLDLPRFEQDLEALRSRVAHERSVGDKLKIAGTPALFVGCQQVQVPLSIETIRSYIEAEVAR